MSIISGDMDKSLVLRTCGSYPTTTPGLHHFSLPVSRPGPSRAPCPPGSGKVTAPAHLPGLAAGHQAEPREWCSPCCQQQFGHVSPLARGCSTTAWEPNTHTPPSRSARLWGEGGAQRRVSPEMPVFSLFPSSFIKAPTLITLLHLAPALPLPLTSPSLVCRAASTPLCIRNGDSHHREGEISLQTRC